MAEFYDQEPPRRGVRWGRILLGLAALGLIGYVGLARLSAARYWYYVDFDWALRGLREGTR
jgi:hypothetical protein